MATVSRDGLRDRVDDVDWRDLAEKATGIYVGAFVATALFIMLGGTDLILQPYPMESWSTASIVTDTDDIVTAIGASVVVATVTVPVSLLGARFVVGRWEFRGWDIGPALCVAALAFVLSCTLLVVAVNLDEATVTELLVGIPVGILYLAWMLGILLTPTSTGALLGYRITSRGFDARQAALIVAMGVLVTLGLTLTLESLESILTGLLEMTGTEA